MQNGSTGKASSDHKAGRDPPELPAIVAEMNNVVAAIAGYAHLLANEYEPPVAGSVSHSVARYKALAQRLQGLLDRPGGPQPPAPEGPSVDAR